MIALGMSAGRAAWTRLGSLGDGVLDTALGVVGVVGVLGLAAACGLAGRRRG